MAEVADRPEIIRTTRGYARTALGQIHYTAAGGGPPIVLLAAAGRSARMFAGLLPALSERFRPIALDTPGFGASDPLPPGTSIEAIGAAFFEALDAIGIDRFALYGLHTGNKIGTAMAVARPDRIAKLFLAGQSHSLIPDQARRNAAILDLVRDYVPLPGVSAPDAGASKTERIRALLDVPGLVNEDHPRLGGHLLDHIADEIQATGTSALYQANLAYDLGRGFSEIRVPTLVLEIATPAETAALGLQGPTIAGLIPGASLATLNEPDYDALTLENRPGDLAEIIAEFVGTGWV